MADPAELARRDATAEARRMREHRDRLIGEVATGAISVDGLIEQHTVDPYSGTIKVVVLAEKVPGVGKVRARRAMATLGIDEDARWGEVDPATLRQLWTAMADAATRPVRAPG